MVSLLALVATTLIAWNDPLALSRPVEVPSPAPARSSGPQLTSTSDGRAVLSWLEPASKGRHRLRVSVRERSAWTEPVTVAQEERVFANWADVPAVAVMRDGTWAASWLSSTGRGSYDIKVSFSKDAGRRWSMPITPHKDSTRTEHGFVSFSSWPGGGLGMIWLDGRDYAKYAGAQSHGAEMMKAEMSLRSTVFERGKTGAELVVDSRVCDCCPTALTATNKGLLAAYRDRSATEIRDIHVARFEHGRWLPGRPIHEDNWQIAACPVNGPALASRGDRVAIAWFTAAGNIGRVFVSFSDDGGATFGAPQRADDGNPEGRVAIAMLADGSAIVQWIERVEQGAEVRIRRLTSAEKKGASTRVAAVTSDRASGYPRVVVTERELVFAWNSGGVKTAVLRIP